MASVCARILPVVGRRAVLQPQFTNQVRYFFDPWARSELRAIMRDMDRFQRDLMRFPLPRLFPVDITTSPTDGSNGSYRIDVDLSGFRPEDIQVDLDESGRILTIQAKCDRKSADGSRFAQQVTKKISIPAAADLTELKSFLHRDGILAIEAPFKEEAKQSSEPRQIPVSRSGSIDSTSSEKPGEISSS